MSVSLTIHCPAKVNLFLAVTGRRTDGFHELSSLVSPLQLGDELAVEIAAGAAADFLECEMEGVPLNADNLVLRASAAFRQRVPDAPACRFVLTKKIPHGAGLGGGSSNAVGAVRAMNQLCGYPLKDSELEGIVAQIGSDCPLFVRQQALVMRGRGERLESLCGDKMRELHGERLALFKPALAIPTAWAYAAYRARGDAAMREGVLAEARLKTWLEGGDDLSALLFNSLQPVVTGKYLTLAAMLAAISERWQLPVLMSGSGSACFALLPEKFDLSPLRELVLEEWGEGSWFVETRLQAI